MNLKIFQVSVKTGISFFEYSTFREHHLCYLRSVKILFFIFAFEYHENNLLIYFSLFLLFLKIYHLFSSSGSFCQYLHKTAYFEPKIRVEVDSLVGPPYLNGSKADADAADKGSRIRIPTLHSPMVLWLILYY